MTVGFDAVPLMSGHAERGIGRYLTGILSALVLQKPDWCREHLSCLISGDQPPIGARFWRTWRAPFRRQDLDWLTSAIADRWAVRKAPPSAWHMTDPSTPISVLPASRTIATAYDLIPLMDETVMRRIRPHRRLIYRRYLQSLQEARMVVAISDTTAEELRQRLDIPRERIHVVYPSIVPPSGLAETGRHRDDRLHLLFVGALEPHKRPELALNVLADLRGRGADAHLTIVGPQPAHHRTALELVASELGVVRDVHFAGRIGDDRLLGLYRTAITLAVSRVEGFGLPPVEALLAGGRVVATPSPIYHEVLGSTATFGADHQPSSVADAVLLAHSGTDRDDAATIDHLEARYAPARAATSLVAAYEAVLAS